ncbi:siderophore-interacting protein [Streptomyces sp. NPDC004111]|uniref:siderophore-interacting protein n=1 Tax=Streptomyces sp. NPDC004111 TaxID=3364690 RepID=UPI0036B82E15
MSRDDHRHRHRERIAEVRAGLRAEDVAYPIRIRETEVIRTAAVGSGLLRVTLGGPGTRGFESHAPDEHVKLFFPDENGALRLPEPDGLMLRWAGTAAATRQYTVREYRPDTGEIDIDIALHEGGLASDWAGTVEPGAVMPVAGPPGGLIVPHTYDRYLLAADLTALPALARWLEELPRHARGWAFAEVADAGEEIELAAPDGFEVHWLHRGGGPAGTGDALAKAVTAVDVPADARLYVWAAGEAGQLKPIRRWVRDELRLARADHDITGYWKCGVSNFDDDDHAH